MNTYVEAQPRIPSMRQQILDKLIEVGDKGVTNIELHKICVKWHSRLSELYAQGYKTDVICEGDGVYRYILTEQPKEIVKHKKATDIVVDTIKDTYGDKITADDFIHILDNCGFTVARKAGVYKGNVN